MKVLTTLHHDANDPDMAVKEFQQIRIQTQADAEKMNGKGSFYVFTDPHYRKRLGIAIGLVCFAQSNGILLIYSK